MITKIKNWTEHNGYLFAVISVVLATLVFFAGRDYFAKGQWAMLYLLLIGLIAGSGGVKPALLASVMAFFAWNYFFLPPYHTFTIYDPKDWLSLFAFLMVGILIGMQTGNMKDREEQALAREREMELLNKLSAQLVSDNTLEDITNMLLPEVKTACGASFIALYIPDKTGRLVEAGGCVTDTRSAFTTEDLKIAEWVRSNSMAVGILPGSGKHQSASRKWPASAGFESLGINETRSDIFLPLQTAISLQGVLHISEKVDSSNYTDSEIQLLVAVANQFAAFLERKVLQDKAIQADALRQADLLKSTLVSSVSHELKTPLAAITATISNLLEQDVALDAQIIRNELEAALDDLLRLNSSISALLDLSRLESDSWAPNRDYYEFGEILGSVLARIPQAQRSRIVFNIPENLPSIYVDFMQWTRVIQNLIENALAYSPAESQVCLGASCTDSDIIMWVEDNGPGIPAEEHKLVFEKFYRGKSSEKIPSGTGLGLAITREIVRYHGGKIKVESVSPHGTRMVLILPRAEEK